MKYAEPLPAKARCRVCLWVGMWRDILRAPHPWDEDDILVGCPDCKAVNTVYEACGVDSCYDPFYVTHYPGGPGPKSGITLCERHQAEYEEAIA